MADVAVLIKTLGREEALTNCVRSVRNRLGEQGISHRIYLADDGPVPEAKQRLYRRLRDEGHLVVEFAERVGGSRARNELADRLEEERWVLRMDDDFELAEETDVRAMRTILRDVPHLGVVADLERQIGDGKGVFSGQISRAQGFFEREGEILVSRLFPPAAFEYVWAGPHRYAHCDFTRNMLLIRREVLREVRWEERLPFAGEHEDFMLQLAEAGWGIAFTPDSVHRHRDDLASAGPDGLREDRSRQRAEAIQVFAEKWGVRQRKVRRSWPDTIRAALVRAKRLGGRLAGFS